MLCKKPFMKGILAFGCGQCHPCRFNRRRLWSHRIQLEALKHSSSCFVTLTYRDDKLPANGSLVPKHVQDWLKRLRKAVHPAALRFFLVGEYGDLGGRPHYHAAVFGLPPCQNFPGLTEFDVYHRASCTCSPCSLIRDTWKMGKTDTGTLTADSASYISSYVTKKMTRNTSDVQREYLQDRHPEFARMSLRPGIGATAMDDVAAVLPAGIPTPTSLSHGGRKQPLGRYLKGKLDGLRGTVPTRPSSLSNRAGILALLQDEFFLSMLELQDAARSNSKITAKSPQKVLLQAEKQKVLNLEAKLKIKKGKKL